MSYLGLSVLLVFLLLPTRSEWRFYLHERYFIKTKDFSALCMGNKDTDKKRIMIMNLFCLYKKRKSIKKKKKEKMQ